MTDELIARHAAQPDEASAPASSTDEVAVTAAAIIAAIETVIEGKPGEISTAVTVLLAEGHLLIEDVPGVGKTALARALARAVGGTVSRIQFTPDLLPSDVTGVAVFDQVQRRFEFKPGAIFANVVIGDEINRASPKTQSALLECMEERQVTVDGVTHPVPRPFVVVATQNPVEMEGTYALPEAQRDRFMARIAMGYPDEAAEVAMLDDRDSSDPLESVSPVVSADELAVLIERVRAVYVAPAVKQYAVALVRGTREDPELRLGASPRATLQLIRAAKARAAIAARGFVIPDDIVALSIPVLAHRVMVEPRAVGRAGASDGVAVAAIRRAVAAVPVPVSAV